MNKLRVENFYLQILVMTRTLYLWTRRGAARHAKMLNTEKAWEVFKKLEEFYFDHEKFEWNKARADGKVVRKKFTDVISACMEKALPYKKIENQIELCANAVDNIFNQSYILTSAYKFYGNKNESDVAAKLLRRFFVVG